MSRELAPTIRVHFDDGRLTGTHVLELRLLEVCGYPDLFQRDDGHQWLARLYDLTDFDRLLADNAAHRRADGRVLKIQLGLLDGRALLQDACVGRRGAGTLRRDLLRA